MGISGIITLALFIALIIVCCHSAVTEVTDITVHTMIYGFVGREGIMGMLLSFPLAWVAPVHFSNLPVVVVSVVSRNEPVEGNFLVILVVVALILKMTLLSA